MTRFAPKIGAVLFAVVIVLYVVWPPIFWIAFMAALVAFSIVMLAAAKSAEERSLLEFVTRSRDEILASTR